MREKRLKWAQEQSDMILGAALDALGAQPAVIVAVHGADILLPVTGPSVWPAAEAFDSINGDHDFGASVATFNSQPVAARR